MSKITLQNVECSIPPVGKVIDYHTGELILSPVLKRSIEKDQQYWEVIPLLNDWNKKRRVEKLKQESNSSYIDPELEEFRVREWGRRLNGVWFMNNGKAEFLTGLHYFYLNYWYIDIGLPDFRKSDWEYFLMLDSVIKDDNCGGLICVEKRRAGKTARSGIFIYDYVSRTKNTYGGIQSKTDTDAQSNVFSKFVINPFKHLPDFFRPTYDTSKGITPSRELRFFNSTKRGAYSEDNLDVPELESWINYKSSKNKAYDGTKLHRYVSDEASKLPADLDPYERHSVVKLCAEEGGRIIGKILTTSTVEDLGGRDEKGKSMKSGGIRFKELWKDSDPTKRSDNNRTISWMYQFFMPAYKTIFFDKYGYADEERAMAYYLAERKAVEHDSGKLNSVIRKAPFTIEEAFRADSDSCLYNAMNLNDRMDFFSYADPKELYTKGNLFELEDGTVDFRESANGKFKIHELPPENLRNRIRSRGSSLEPMNTAEYVMSVDPFSHSAVQFGKGSDGAGYVFKRPSIIDPDNSNKFVAQYLHRPPTTHIFYKDMLMLAKFYGCPVLFENNKQGMKDYFEVKNCGQFLIWLPKQKSAGIAASKQSHQLLAEATELYIEDYCNLVPFKEMVEDWLDFDLNDTEKYDSAMAVGWGLVANEILSKRFTRNMDSSSLANSKMFRKRRV